MFRFLYIDMTTFHVWWKYIAASEPLKDLRGYTFGVSTVPYFPYVAYSRDTPERGTKVTLQDSLNVRILNTVSTALNFT